MMITAVMLVRYNIYFSCKVLAMQQEQSSNGITIVIYLSLFNRFIVFQIRLLFINKN